MTVMPFGKFVGKPLTEVPQRYLQWTLEKCTNLTDALKEDIQCVVNGLPLPERPAEEVDTLEGQLAAIMRKR